MLDDTTFVLGRLLTLPFTAALLGDVLVHDFDTHRHMLSVGTLCARVGLAAGIGSGGALTLAQAGLFHDIGKTRVASALLRSSDPLTADDWTVIRSHPTDGEAILTGVEAVELAAIVRGHHERLDGSGYPDGLCGLRIPDATRLLSVVDAYDAMRAGRPYAKPVSHADALARLEAAPHLYDRDAVVALIKSTEGAQATYAAP